MFHDDGTMRVDPNNVVDVDDELSAFRRPSWDAYFDQGEPWVDSDEVFEETVEFDIPTDDDITDYEVMSGSIDDAGHGIDLGEEEEAPRRTTNAKMTTNPIRKNRD